MTIHDHQGLKRDPQAILDLKALLSSVTQSGCAGRTGFVADNTIAHQGLVSLSSLVDTFPANFLRQELPGGWKALSKSRELQTMVKPPFSQHTTVMKSSRQVSEAFLMASLGHIPPAPHPLPSAEESEKQTPTPAQVAAAQKAPKH